MSKKMIKRSLALSALMAFVITGSAMAADYAPEDVKIPKGQNVGAIFNETITGYENVTLTNSLGNGLGTGTNVVNATTKVTINALVGINGYGKNTVSAPTIEINATDDGIFVPHEGNAKVNINGFNSLTINATEGHAVINNGLATNENSLVIKGNAGSTITLNGNAARPTIAAKTDSASTSISAGTITVNGNSDNKYKGVIYAANGSNLSVVADTLVVNNDGSNADNAVVRIEASNNSEDGTKVVLGGNTITINANGARGVNVRNGTGVDVGGNGSVELGDANTKTININDASYGILVQYNGTSAAVKVQSGELNIINGAGNGVAGIWAMNGNLTDSDADDNANVTIGKSTNTVIKLADDKGNVYGSAIAATSQAKVDIAGNLEVVAKKAILTRGESIININCEGGKQVNLIGDIVFGDGTNADNDKIDATVNLNLDTAKSSFEGGIYTATKYDERNDREDEVTGMNLGLSNGATWTVTGDSFVNNLKGNGGIIELQKVNDTFAKVNILTKDYSKNLTVQQAGVTADSFDTQEKQQAQLESLAGLVTEGSKEAADKFAIAEGAVVGAVTADVTIDSETGKTEVGKAVEAVNTVNKSIGEAAVVGIAHFRAHMNDMNKRMGELRMANGEAGVWTRMVRGEEEFAGAKSQYNQYQLGYDEKLSVDKRWTVGAAVTFAEGSGNFTNGSIENDSTAFAIYGSKLNNDGTFVDLIGRYAKFDSDVTMNGEKADYSTNGMSVSAEFGKRIQQGNGLWIEPQFELTYGTVDSAEYTIAGRNVQVGDMDSLIGRVGFSLGKDIKQGNVYARASYLYDFDGETETTFGKGDVTRTIAEDLGGGWWEVGVGANINLSKATYIYADVEKTFGGEVDTNWKWNLGVRYSF